MLVLLTNPKRWEFTRMERDLWKRIVTALRAVSHRRPRNAEYHDGQILAVLLWAALHDRPISWACRRENWPAQAHRRSLPDQSTMSRRLRHPMLLNSLDQVLQRIQRSFSNSEILIVDGKPLELSEYTGDPDARTGRGAGRYAKGYRLSVIIDAMDRVLAWSVSPMNTGESVVARQLVECLEGSEKPRQLLGDAAYDSNPLYEAASAKAIRLRAPRKKQGALGHRNHHPDRISNFREMKSNATRRVHRAARASVERFFGALASFGAGLASLPPWVRRLHRSRLWVGAKLAINAARIAHRGGVAA